MNILLLSGYDAPSHQRWHAGLVAQFPEYQWQVLTLPPRYFYWRVRGNSLSWAFEERALLEQHYDLILATSMVDISALRGMVPHLASIPTIVYFHENQFAYPENSAETKASANSDINSLVPVQMLSLYTALCGDRLVFNSIYNRDTFFLGADRLLKKMPDHVPAGLVAGLKEKSSVLPVPLEQECFLSPKLVRPTTCVQIVWNHRWEYDKAPDRLLACVRALPEELPITFHIAGQQFRSEPESFAEIKLLLNSRGWLGTWGFVENIDEYRQLLVNTDVVLSTALHDFQGLAVLEAVAAGCIPVVPNRLAYQELFDTEFRYLSNVERAEDEAKAAAAMIVNRTKQLIAGQCVKANDAAALGWKQLRPVYKKMLTDEFL